MSSATNPRRLLAPEKAIEILTQLIDEALWLQNEPSASPSRERWASTARAALERAFPPNSSIIQRFETADTFAFNQDTTDEEMRRMANSVVDTQVAILRSGRDQLSWESDDRSSWTAKSQPVKKATGDQPQNSGNPALDILRESIKAVPAVKWALGVAGIVSVIAIVQGLKVDFRIAVFGSVIVVMLMTMLVVFARLAKITPNKLTLPALVFTWFALLIAIATASLLFTSVFWRWPVDLQSWLGQSSPMRPVIAGVYESPGGSWERSNDGWVEHAMAHPNVLVHLEEFRHDADYIYLVDRSRTRDAKEADNFMLLRLPIKGGMAQWSWSNPISWVDLTPVTPKQ